MKHRIAMSLVLFSAVVFAFLWFSRPPLHECQPSDGCFLQYSVGVPNDVNTGWYNMGSLEFGSCFQGQELARISPARPDGWLPCGFTISFQHAKTLWLRPKN